MKAEYQEKLIDLLLETKALKFGEFTLKSGRESPFFMNLGEVNDGEGLNELGGIYAEAVYDLFGDEPTVFFGPAYKGIPLAVATAMQYQWLYDADHVGFCSNRKEAKDHGDSGILLGRKLRDGDKVVIVEDVVTSGSSVDEAVEIIRQQAKVKILGLIVAFDRHEYGKDPSKTALQEIAEEYKFGAHGIINMSHVVDQLLEYDELDTQVLREIQAYYAMYGPEGEEGFL